MSATSSRWPGRSSYGCGLWPLAGCFALLGDPGRAYLPSQGLRERARTSCRRVAKLEDRESRDTVVWEVLPPEGVKKKSLRVVRKPISDHLLDSEPFASESRFDRRGRFGV